MNVTIVKIGGSIITKKSGTHIDKKAISELAKKMKKLRQKLILVHGTGHVGKPPAIRYGYVKTRYLPPKKALLALQIKNKIDLLTAAVQTTFCNLGIPVLAIDSNHFINYKSKTWESKQLHKFVKRLVINNITPIFSGNFIPEKRGGFEVLSSDEIVLRLARLLKPKRIIFLTDVNGILDKKGETITSFSSSHLSQLKKSTHDVSGGMKEKAKIGINIKNYCKDCIIANGKKDISFIQHPKNKLITGTRIVVAK